MLFLKKINKPWLMAIFALVVIVAGCDKKDDAPVTDTIAKKIDDDPNLSIFKAAMAKARLQVFTEGAGPFTVFAPDNNAWKAGGINSEADLNGLDSSGLVTVLIYHILSSARSSYEIPVGPNAPITTQGPFNIFTSKNTNGIFVNGTKILTPDIQCSNGILHVVNRVLIPPVTSIINNINSTANLRLFSLAVGKSGLTTTFSPATGSPITVFAPSNAAFTAIGLDSTGIANSNVTALANMLRYHVVSGRFFASDLKADSIKTLLGPKALVTLNNGPKIKGLANTLPANLISPDINANNGVIHIIDIVLKYQ